MAGFASNSKNARMGSNVNLLICKCGGEIKMHSIAFAGKRIRHYAKCKSCKEEARKPKDLFDF